MKPWFRSNLQPTQKRTKTETYYIAHSIHVRYMYIYIYIYLLIHHQKSTRDVYSIYHTCIAIGTIVIHIAYTRQNTFGKDSAYKHRPPCGWQQNGSFLVSPSTSQQFYRIMGHGDLYRSSGESWFAKSDSTVDPYVPGCYIQFLSVLKGTWKSRLPRINLLAACLRSVATSRSSIRDSGTNKIGSYWP